MILNMEKVYIKGLFCTVKLIVLALKCADAALLTISSPTNCGEDTTLTCTDANPFSFWAIYHNDSKFLTHASNFPKYSSSLSGITLVVTIHNTSLNDIGTYTCAAGYSPTSLGVSLFFECKVTSYAATIINTKKLTIRMEKVYPGNISLTARVESGGSSTSLGGTPTCIHSPTFEGYFSCTWTSDSSLADGQYTYRAVVTTLTANTISGTFRIATPDAPTFSNIANEYNQVVLRGDVGSPLNVICTSSGGYPVQTVVLYFDGKQRASANTGTMHNDLYTVAVTYTMPQPARIDDLKILCCNSSYPNADNGYKGSRGSCVPLWLIFPPSQVSVSQLAIVVSGSSVSVICTASGGRPAAGLTWSYNGTTTSPQVTTSIDDTTYTYTAVSTFTRAVTEADNGKTIQCFVSHRSLVTPIYRTAVLNVTFSPLNVNLTGNTNDFNADGKHSLILTCKVGSSNPAPTIQWYNGTLGGDVISNSQPYTDKEGQFNGVSREQTLDIYPTRYNEGQSVTCSASNNIGNEKSATINLNLHYSAIISSMIDQTAREGDTNFALKCQAWSKPPATFRWYKEGNTTLLHQVTGTLDDNSGTYVIPVVSRQQAGRYECRAENGVGNADAKHVHLSVQFPALNTTITGATDIYANGVNKVNLTCNTGSSNPSSSITWYRDSQLVTSSKPLTSTGGEYGGKITSQILEFVPTREMDGHVVECRAGNEMSSSLAQWARVALDLKYDPSVSVTTGSVEIDETQSGSLSCTVDSKPPSTITWTRVDRASALPTNRLTRGSNSLEYTISTTQREDAGQYRCTANNNYGGNKHNDTLIVVRYAPDVIVVAQNTTVNASSVDVRCNPIGVPATYTYTTWEQVWPGYGLVRIFSGSNILTLTRLTYEDSGVYTCKVENGVPYSRNPSVGKGQAQLNILSFPVIASAQTTINVAVQIGKVSEFSFEFFSNALEEAVNITNENSKSISDIAFTTIMPKNVTIKVFGYNIKVVGFLARTKLNITKQEELGTYNLFVRNSIGSRSLSLILIPEGPPGRLKIISINNVQQTSVVVTWTRGFHGGFNQSVYVEVSVDSHRWEVKLILNEGKNEDKNEVNTPLQQLQPGTLYYIRMHAENNRGKSGYTRIFNVTLLDSVTTEKSPNAGPSIGGAIGGVLATVVAKVVLVVIIRRKYEFHCNVFVTRKKEGPSETSISGAFNPSFDAAQTYEDVSMTTGTSVYDALKNGNNG
ncbi:synaptogenesis protein syg-2-like [Mya arenaria]|uniref:synaptogenesis protein syg-2-like n=1 Tax=Mya arenaria TaxID=6604 RepID=UPI0022E148C0|nr:synaptogenesis protein syg-2-like [Mya arenaria]